MAKSKQRFWINQNFHLDCDLERLHFTSLFLKHLLSFPLLQFKGFSTRCRFDLVVRCSTSARVILTLKQQKTNKEKLISKADLTIVLLASNCEHTGEMNGWEIKLL